MHDAEAPEQLWFLDTLVRIRVPHSEGEDGISLIENWAAHRNSPPLHIHHTEDELFQVLEGEFRFVVGKEERRAGPGDVLLAPKGIPHTYRVESAAGGHWLVTTTHGEFERFVREVSHPAATPELPPSSGPPTREETDQLAGAALRHHIELVGPPLV